MQTVRFLCDMEGRRSGERVNAICGAKKNFLQGPWTAPVCGDIGLPVGWAKLLVNSHLSAVLGYFHSHGEQEMPAQR